MTTVEYGVMLVLVGLVVAAFGSGLSGSVTDVFSRTSGAIGVRDGDTPSDQNDPSTPRELDKDRNENTP